MEFSTELLRELQALWLSYMEDIELFNLIKNYPCLLSIFHDYVSIFGEVHVPYHANDNDLRYYKGVKNLSLLGCDRLSGKGFIYLEDTQSIDLTWCAKLR